LSNWGAAVPFNDIELQRIKKLVGGFCEQRIPDHLRSQIKVFYEIRGYDVRITETRPHYMKSNEWTESPIARLKYDPDILEWQLYWMRASGKWQKYAEFKPTNNLQSVIEEIEKDPYCVFWG
jgi:hypothetical protein